MLAAVPPMHPDPRTALDQLAGDVVLLDFTDADGLQQILTGLSQLLIEPMREEIAEAIRLLHLPVKDASRTTQLLAQTLDAAGAKLDARHLHPAEVVAGDDDPVRLEFLGRASDAVADLAGLIDRLTAGEPVVPELRRAVHTLKGEAGALDLRHPARVLHALEDRLETDGPAAAAIARQVVDWCADCFDSLRRGEGPGPDPTALLATISAPEAAGSIGTASGTNAGDRRLSIATSMRVDVARLDALHDAVGELVVVHTMLAGAPELLRLRDRRLRALFATLERTTATVQALTSGLRLVPLRGLLQRSARIARETARQLGREVAVQLDGEDQEIDRSVADRLAEPLLHLVRNAIDHGLETPDERRAAGKPATGNLTITAGSAAGGFTITVRDDGRGIDRERIVARARKEGLLADGGGAPCDLDVDEMLFRPGFSTAHAVSEVSGRGVGLDAVRSAVTALRGQVSLTGGRGTGCTATIHLPTTLAVIDGLTVEAGGQRLVVPTDAVVCSQRLPTDCELPPPGRRRLLTVQDRQVALIGLADALGYPPAPTAPRRPMAVVVESGAQRVALGVDAVLGRQQVVLKDLGRGMPPPPGIGGAAIAADGRPMLVIDIAGILRHLLGDDAVRKAS